MTEPPSTDGPARPITDLIETDHDWFRRQFRTLDDLHTAGAGEQELSSLWTPLSARLDIHAIAEEKVFYPELLRVGEDDPEDETIDAIGDHNDIRDGLHAADEHPVGSDGWWDAVRAAREANDEHMAEEERDGIPDFKAQAPAARQVELGRRFADYLRSHPTTDGVDTSDKDPETYVRETEIEVGVRTPDAARSDTSSLGIGSLKGSSS